MKVKTVKLDRPRGTTYGWCNRLLRVDLSDGRIWAEETGERGPMFLGARGLAAKVLWDEYPEPVDAFDPRNPFMVMPGTLTGTRSPYSGRTNVCAFSPQAHPYTWFTRASIGADWGATLKKAGYDGIVVTGASEKPVYVLIQDDEVSIRPADGMWGLDAVEAQEAAQAAHGKHTRTLTIGPAGENLSRIATVHTASTSVAGQGGFGAVMGSKKLKAISVVGSGHVAVADPDRIQHLFRAIGDEVRPWKVGNRRNSLQARNEELAAMGGGRVRAYPCTASCPTPCSLYMSDVPGCASPQKWTGGMACVSGLFGGGRGMYGLVDWKLEGGWRAAFELNMHANRLGLNHWDLIVGMLPWLRTCEKQGILPNLSGRVNQWDSNAWWMEWLSDIAFRRGDGDALAEGGYRAAHVMNLGVEFMERYYTGWGFSGHWDGHAALVNPIIYPFWIAGAVHWAMDTRDPASSTHGYVQNTMYFGPLGYRANSETQGPITWDQMMGIGERVYGRADTLDPKSGYEGKAIPAAVHGVRSIMKDCLPTDDQVFPLFYSHTTPDRFPVIDGIPGPDIDAALFRAGTGLDWDPAEFERAAERVLNLERAITIRHWGRDRRMDERVIPAFEYKDNWTNPETGENYALDRTKFEAVMDEHYQLRGWDIETGWPTQDTLDRLDVGDIYQDMVEGAAAAKERLPELDPVGPITDVHANEVIAGSWEK